MVNVDKSKRGGPHLRYFELEHTQSAINIKNTGRKNKPI